MKKVLFAAIMLCFIGNFDSRAATGLEGKYTVSGTNPNETKYAGLLEITRKNTVYQLRWVVGKTTYTGSGLQTGNVLSVAYTIPKVAGCGVVAYTIADSSLNGTWAACGGGTAGTEIAVRK